MRHGVTSGVSCEKCLNKHVTPHLHRVYKAKQCNACASTNNIYIYIYSILMCIYIYIYSFIHIQSVCEKAAETKMGPEGRLRP